MDPAILSASAALLGSLAGGSSLLATAWMNQKAQGKRVSIQTETRKREQLYSEFITECSKLVLDALDHSLDRPETLQQAYTLVNRIRLTSGDAVLHAAEKTIEAIIARYRAPNMSIQGLLEMPLAAFHDPLKAFSDTCRSELSKLQQDRI